MVSVRRNGSVATKGAPPPNTSPAALIAASSVFQNANVNATSTASSSMALTTTPPTSTRRRSVSLPPKPGPITRAPVQQPPYPTPPSSPNSSANGESEQSAPAQLSRSGNMGGRDLRNGMQPPKPKTNLQREGVPIGITKEMPKSSRDDYQNHQSASPATEMNTRNFRGHLDVKNQNRLLDTKQETPQWSSVGQTTNRSFKIKDTDQVFLSDASEYETAPEYLTDDEKQPKVPVPSANKQNTIPVPHRTVIRFASRHNSYVPVSEREPRRWSSDSESEESTSEADPFQHVAATTRGGRPVVKSTSKHSARGSSLPAQPAVSSLHRSDSSSSDSVKSASSYKRMRNPESRPFRRADGTRTMRSGMTRRHKNWDATSRAAGTKEPRGPMTGRSLRSDANNTTSNDVNEVHLLGSLRDDKEQEELQKRSRKMSFFNKLKHSYGSKHQTPTPINTQDTAISTLPTPPATPANKIEATEATSATIPTANKEVHLRDTLRDNDKTTKQQPARKESLRSKLTYPYGSKHQLSSPIHDQVTIDSTLPAPVVTSSKTTTTAEAITEKTPTVGNGFRLLDTPRDQERSTDQQYSSSSNPVEKESLLSKLTYPYGSKRHRSQPTNTQNVNTTSGAITSKATEPAVAQSADTSSTADEVYLPDTLKDHDHTAGQQQSASSQPVRKESILSKLKYPYGTKYPHTKPIDTSVMPITTPSTTPLFPPQPVESVAAATKTISTDPIDFGSKNENQAPSAAANKISLPKSLQDGHQQEKQVANIDPAHKASILDEFHPHGQKQDTPPPAVPRVNAFAETKGIDLPSTLRNNSPGERKEKRPAPGAWPSTSTVDAVTVDSEGALTSSGHHSESLATEAIPDTNEVNLPKTLRNNTQEESQQQAFSKPVRKATILQKFNSTKSKPNVAPPLDGIESASDEAITAAQCAADLITIPPPKRVRQDTIQIAKKTSPKREGANPAEGFTSINRFFEQPAVPEAQQRPAPSTTQAEAPAHYVGNRAEDGNYGTVNGVGNEKRGKAIRDISFSNTSRNGVVQGKEGRGVGDVDFNNIGGAEARERKKRLWEKLVG